MIDRYRAVFESVYSKYQRRIVRTGAVRYERYSVIRVAHRVALLFCAYRAELYFAVLIRRYQCCSACAYYRCSLVYAYSVYVRYAAVTRCTYAYVVVSRNVHSAAVHRYCRREVTDCRAVQVIYALNRCIAYQTERYRRVSRYREGVFAETECSFAVRYYRQCICRCAYRCICTYSAYRFKIIRRRLDRVVAVSRYSYRFAVYVESVRRVRHSYSDSVRRKRLAVYLDRRVLGYAEVSVIRCRRYRCSRSEYYRVAVVYRYFAAAERHARVGYCRRCLCIRIDCQSYLVVVHRRYCRVRCTESRYSVYCYRCVAVEVYFFLFVVNARHNRFICKYYRRVAAHQHCRITQRNIFKCYCRRHSQLAVFCRRRCICSRFERH